jgi:hypothetical protein
MKNNKQDELFRRANKRVILIALASFSLCVGAGVLGFYQGTPTRLSEKTAATLGAPASFQRWRNHFYGSHVDAYQWVCRKTTEGEPKGHYCTVEGGQGRIRTLYCNEKSCDIVILVHEARWFSAP